MFIIWGWRAVKAVLATGFFFCPQCQADRGYRHIRPRRWFTVFFIPLIPLDRLPAHVECDACHGAFLEVVLEAPTAAQFEHAIGLASRAAVAHVVSVTGPTTAAVEGGTALLAQSPGVLQPYTEQHLRADLSAFTDRAVALGYVAPLVGPMTIDGREDFVRRLVVLGERLGTAAEEPVAAVASALGLSAAHLAGIREQAAQAAGGAA